MTFEYPRRPHGANLHAACRRNTMQEYAGGNTGQVRAVSLAGEGWRCPRFYLAFAVLFR
jgi:hypothetical protein